MSLWYFHGGCSCEFQNYAYKTSMMSLGYFPGRCSCEFQNACKANMTSLVYFPVECKQIFKFQIYFRLLTTKWVVKVYNVEELCGSYYSSWRWTIVVFLQLFYLGDKLPTIYIHIFYLSRICFASILEFTWTSTREIPKGHHTCFVVSIILEFTWAPTRKIPEGHFDLEGILFWPLFCFISDNFWPLMRP